MRSERFFQPTEHDDLISAIKSMGFAIDYRGMCYGYAATSIYHYYLGKLSEQDEVVDKVLGCINETHEYFDSNENEYSPENFLEHLQKKLNTEDDLLIQAGKMSITDLFKKISSLQYSQQQDLPFTDIEQFPVKNVLALEVTGVYDLNDLTNYFNSLQNIINKNISTPDHPGLAMLMGRLGHVVMIGMQPHQDLMLFRDIEHINDENLNFENSDNLAIIKGALPHQKNSEYTFFTTMIFIPQGNELLLKCVTEWQQTNEYKNLHELSLERIMRVCGDNDSLFVDAVVRNNLPLAKTIFDTYPAIPQDMLALALCYAIERKHDVMVLFVLDKMTDFDLLVTMGGQKFTLLEYAIQNNNIQVATEFLAKEQYLNVNTKNSLKLSWFLHQAKKQGRVDEVKAFLENKCEINLSEQGYENSDLYGLTPLHVAAFLGQEEIVRKLLERGAQILFSQDDISPDELAKAMNYEVIAQMIQEKYWESLLAEVNTLKNSVNEQAFKVLEGMIENKADLVTCQDEFTKLNAKLKLLNALTMLEKSKESVNEEAAAHLQQIILNGGSPQQSQSAYKMFEDLVSMSERIASQKKSKFFPQVHEDWKNLIDNFYAYFISKTDFNYVELKEKINLFNNALKQNGLMLKDPISKSYAMQKNQSMTQFAITDTAKKTI